MRACSFGGLAGRRVHDALRQGLAAFWTSPLDVVCKLKSALACPQNMVDILLLQTDLTEPQIHVEYMRFRSQYPTGYVGPHVLRNLCIDVLREEDCDYYVDSVFKLYGQKKRGWGAKLIGFREVILATECVSDLNQPNKVLRWLFRVFDAEGKGEISVRKIELIIVSILQ